MARLDPEDVIADVNRALAETLGRPADALRGRGLASLVHRADLGVDAERREALRHDGRSSYEVELRLLHADGTPVPCLVSLSAVAGRDGEGASLLVQVKDLRDRKRAEAEREALVREQAARREAERVAARLSRPCTR